jgi:hypothetical protein
LAQSETKSFVQARFRKRHGGPRDAAGDEANGLVQHLIRVCVARARLAAAFRLICLNA